MKKIELLAPAGSLETLKAVCMAGADAVYVGGSRFGARAYAKNFTQEELLYAIDYLHLHQKKMHLTVNTLLKNRELEEQLYDYLLPFYEQGLDAVIVQDAGVFAFIKEHFPGLELHASTQMTITGADGAQFWKDAGADRVVLARELSLEEIRYIHDNVDIDLECFVHGALCYCYSGQCLFSSMLGGRSGNRGRCAQPCRLPYGVSDAEHKAKKGELYPLSPKDLCAIDLLPELVRAGVSSLKIEGRMKQTQYAAGVTAIYRKYLDLIEEMAGQSGHERSAGRWTGYTVAKEDREALLGFGNRSGFTDGYLKGEKGREMISLQSPKHTSSQDPVTDVREEKRVLNAVCTCRVGSPVTLTVTDPESKNSVTACFGEVQEAKNAPVQMEEVQRVICQTGDTGFQFSAVVIDLDDQCFIPKQFLKAVRREALQKMEEALLQSYRRTGQERQKEDFSADLSFVYKQELPIEHILTVCDTTEQLAVCLKKDYVETIACQMQSCFPEDISREITKIARQCKACGKKFLLELPPVLRKKTADCYEQQWNCMKKMHDENIIDGFLAKNYDSLEFLHRMGILSASIWLDSQLYTFSDRAVSFFRERGYKHHTLSLELNARELRRLTQDGSVLTVYGHAPFMVSTQCVNKTMYVCDRKEKMLMLTDRYEKKIPVKNYCGVCCNVIYNAVPTLLFSDGRTWSEVKKLRPQTLRMDFTVESEEATSAVLALYEQQVLGRPVNDRIFDGESTRGHFMRGVE